MASKACAALLKKRRREMSIKRAIILFAIVEFIVTAFVVVQVVQK